MSDIPYRVEVAEGALPRKGNMHAILTVGCSASGKSTWANTFCAQKGYLNINRDDIRFSAFGRERDWRKWKHSRNIEESVSNLRRGMIQAAAAMGKNIVLSDTNLDPGKRKHLAGYLKALGYSVEYYWFDNVSFEELCRRDAFRQNGVGVSVIARQWEMLQKQLSKRRYADENDGRKASCFICDIDGTLAKMEGRSPYDWHRVEEDSVHFHVHAVLLALKHCGYDIVFLSGRDSVCREATAKWIEKHFGSDIWEYAELFMRTEGDVRKDTIVKEELFWSNVFPHYNVIGVFDDRPAVCRMWRDLGLPVFQLGNPYIEF